MPPSLVFPEAQLLGNLSETLAAHVQAVPANNGTIRATSSARATAFAVFAFLLRLLFNHDLHPQPSCNLDSKLVLHKIDGFLGSHAMFDSDP